MLAMLHADNRVTRTGPLVDRAAVLAERSRGLLLARQLEGRTDLGELRSAHPELADRFEALTAQLAAGPDELAALRSDDNPPAAGRIEWARLVKFRASRDLDALIEQIRAADDDLSDFLRPFTAGQLRELAARGPVVMLNYPAMAPAGEVAAPVGPFALVVTSKAITSVRLAIERSEVVDVARRWTDAIAAVNSRGVDRPGPAQLRGAVEEMVRILSWTWHRVVGPVLAAAELPARADGADWPRIWWIPDGPFHALPFHAAQCPSSGCEWGGPDRAGCGAALDAVVSSYVPGFRTLAHARRRAAGSSAAEGPALIVAITDDELPGAETAARVAAERLDAGRPLIGPAATRAAVTGALAEASVAHFGCHATSDPTEPSGGVLYLPGGEQLTVREICRARPRAARLAFLTACSTARTSQRLASEAIHLSSAFLIAGFGAAVGTLWEIDSRDACQVTTEFYQRITGRPPQDGAVALHHCVRALRHERSGAPYIWSAFVHAGA
jgi:CHAT domain